MPLDDLMTRRASFAPSTLDRDAGTVEAIASTFAPVQRGSFLERLDPAAIAPESLVGLPVLDGHKQGAARDVVGRVIAARMDAQGLVVTIKRTTAPDADPTWHRVEDGTLSGLSIGYSVEKWRESNENGQRVRTATQWRIREVSIVPIPADPQSRFRSHEMPTTPETLETDDRAALIQRCQTAHALPDDWATRMEEAGDLLTDQDVIEDARATARAARQTRTAPVIRTAAPTNDDPAVIRTRQVEALTCRMTGEAPSDAARPFMGYGLTDHARDCLTRSGESVAALGREELMTRAMHGTSDFSMLLTESGNRVLAQNYRRAQSPLMTLARRRTMADFRPTLILKLGEFTGLKKISESGEVKSMTTGEAKEGYALETHAGTFALSRKAIINDDLNAFGQWGEMMGRAAAEAEIAQLMALLLQASGAGPVMGEDNTRLFHASHGNLASPASALSETSLSAARLAMRTMKGLDGKTPIAATPRYLLVSPELETQAEKLLAAIQPATSDDVNPFAGRLSLLVEPRLTGNAWYVFADPAVMPVLEVAYLASAPGPQLSSRDGWEVLGREFRVVLDFGCGATDWRGAYRNAGA